MTKEEKTIRNNTRRKNESQEKRTRRNLLKNRRNLKSKE